MKKWPKVALLVMGTAILGATVLSGPIASAAQSVSATITGPLDGQGNVKVHEQGTANVNVLGNVSTQGAIPATQFSLRRFLQGAPDVVSGPDPSGTNYAITSVSFANLADTPTDVTLVSDYGTTTDCETFNSEIDGIGGPLARVPANDTVSMTFPQPFVMKARPGANSCLVAGAGLGTLAEITVVGYTF